MSRQAVDGRKVEWSRVSKLVSSSWEDCDMGLVVSKVVFATCWLRTDLVVKGN